MKGGVFISRLLLLAVLGVGWEVWLKLASINPILLVPPSSILGSMWGILAVKGQVPHFYHHLGITLVEILAAFGLTASAGLLLGFMFGRSRLLGNAFEPILLGLFAIPKVIIYPIIFMTLGLESLPKIVFGFIVGVFSVVFNTAAGLRQVEQHFITLATSVGCNRWQTFFKVILPAAAPTILSGLRLGFGYTMIGVIVGELLVVNAGLGFLIDWAAFQYLTPELLALVLITMGIGVAGNLIFTHLERRVTP